MLSGLRPNSPVRSESAFSCRSGTTLPVVSSGTDIGIDPRSMLDVFSRGGRTPPDGSLFRAAEFPGGRESEQVGNDGIVLPAAPGAARAAASRRGGPQLADASCGCSAGCVPPDSVTRIPTAPHPSRTIPRPPPIPAKNRAIETRPGIPRNTKHTGTCRKQVPVHKVRNVRELLRGPGLRIVDAERGDDDHLSSTLLGFEMMTPYSPAGRCSNVSR